MIKNLINAIFIITVLTIIVSWINYTVIEIHCHQVSNTVKTKAEVILTNSNILEPIKYEVDDIYTNYYPYTKLYLSRVTISSVDNKINSTEKKLIIKQFIIYSSIKNGEVLISSDPIEVKQLLHIN